MSTPRWKRAGRRAVVLGLGSLLAGGCARGLRYVPADERVSIDRAQVEFPNNLELTTFVEGLTAPVAIGFEADEPRYKGSTVIAESGRGFLAEPRIIGFLPTGQQFPIYPRFTRIPLLDEQFRIRGPIYAMAVAKGKIYVAHRDDRGNGIITALDYDGGHSTVVADLPTLGDYGITDMAVHPTNGRLYFGIGAATNSGVVGLDNFQSGWVNDHPDFADQPLGDLKLTGFRFQTKNPNASFFGESDVAVTGPFQAFNSLGRLKIPANPLGKPTSAVYSVNLEGGDLKVEAHGIRLPRGLVFTEYGNLFVTNDGMELRGTRPIKNDPDSVLRVPLGGQLWYGFPDFSTDLRSIDDPAFQPPEDMVRSTGYPQVATVIDREASGLVPLDRNSYVRGVFPSLSGAAKMAFVPDYPSEPFKPFRGQLIVALSGDRAPFATGGQPLTSSGGFRVKIVDLDSGLLDPKHTGDFVVNTQRKPASQIQGTGYELERPVDVKFGPDGALYILDYGRMEMKKGQEQVYRKTGRVYRLGAPVRPTTEPSPGHSPAKSRNYQDAY